jgi:thiol-disulfide isomerase/thioredoxin
VRSLALAGLAVLLVAPAARAGEGTALLAVSVGTPESDDQKKQPEQPIAERYAQIQAECAAQLRAANQAAAKARNPPEKGAVSERRAIDVLADYARRVLDLAESSPHDPATRDALLWLIDMSGARDTGAYGDQFARAAALLVRHHGDDPDAVRVGLKLDHLVSPRRDALLLGFYAAAKGREAKGLARLALAQYLANKAKEVAYARRVEGRPKRRMVGRGSILREFDLTDEEYADFLELRQCDPQAIQAEADRLFEEVITDYGDVPHVTQRARVLEALLKAPTPARNGKPLTAEERRRIEERLARKTTLGQEAEARLDDMVNLAVGKPAPDIEGVDIEGKPLKLSDYRGKVVVLVFWGTWCGPCMAMVPHERELALRLKEQPFALLGVDCEHGDKDTARAVMARERMTWPNWFEGAVGTGPIAKRYHIRGYPRVFVLDARGVIRFRTASSVGVEDVVDKLLAEMKRPTSGQETSRPGPAKD